MPRTALFTLSVFIVSLGLLMASSHRTDAQPPGSAEAFDNIFPLDKGTYWIYRGPVESGDGNETVKKDVTWKMEVTDFLTRQDIRAAVIHGFPEDLWWYTEKTQPEDHLIIQVFPARFYILSQVEVPKALSALRDDKNILQGLVKDAGLFLDFPLVKGKRFGETELITRTDEFYSWVVSDERQARLEGIQGVSATKEWTLYTLSQFTLGSHEEFDFVPGIGITRYMGHHNGTVSDFDMKLVEYHPGSLASNPR